MTFALFVLLAAADAPAPGPALLDPGTYDARELPGEAKPGSEWLALCPRAGGAQLRKARLQIRNVRSVFAGDGPKDRSARQVAVAACPKPLAIVRAAALRAGPVTTVAGERFS